MVVTAYFRNLHPVTLLPAVPANINCRHSAPSFCSGIQPFFPLLMLNEDCLEDHSHVTSLQIRLDYLEDKFQFEVTLF